MYAHLRKVIPLAALIVAVATVSLAQAQLFRRGQPIPTQPTQPQAVPNPQVQQPTPDTQQTSPPAVPAPNGAAVPGQPSTFQGQPSTELHGQAGTERDHGRFLHGKALMGMNIWGPNQQYVGRVQDFVIDSQGECPTLFLAVAPQINGWSNQYVVVPFNAFQVGFDTRQHVDYFRTSIGLDALQRAPHVAVDQWSKLDPALLTSAREFYRPTEHTAARPPINNHDQQPGERTQNDRDRDQHNLQNPQLPQGGQGNAGQPNPQRSTQPAERNDEHTRGHAEQSKQPTQGAEHQQGNQERRDHEDQPQPEKR